MMRQRNICIAEFVGWQLDKITRRDQPARFFGLALALSMVLLLLGCSEIRPTLDSFTDKAKPATLSQRTEKVTAYRLNLRGEPSAQSSILAVLSKGDLLTIRSQERNWIKVLTQDGMEGWVNGCYLTGFDECEKTRKTEIASAASMKDEPRTSGQSEAEVRADELPQSAETSSKAHTVLATHEEVPPLSREAQPSGAQQPSAGGSPVKFHEEEKIALFEDEEASGKTLAAPVVQGPVNSGERPLMESHGPKTGDALAGEDITGLEKWVSPQGVVSVYRPKTWEVTEKYTGDAAEISVHERTKNTGVSMYLAPNKKGITDCLYAMGYFARLRMNEYPDLRLTNIRATPDRAKAFSEVSFTCKGVPIRGRYYSVASPQAILVVDFHAPAETFAEKKQLLLMIVNNIEFYDKVEEGKRVQRFSEQVQPVTAQMVWRKAPDGSSRVLAPAHWAYQAGKGMVLLGSEKEDAGFVFTNVEVSSGMRLPGLLFSPFLPPNQFIGLFLGQYGGATGVQVLEAEKDTDPSVQQFMQITGKHCDAQDLTVRFNAKSGRTCLAAFKVINTAPSPISGIWYSIVSGFWAPEEKFAAYAPLLIQVGNSFQINEEYARNYIQSGLANLRRLQQKTQEAMQKLNQARYDQQKSWEANQARKDYSNWKFSQYMRGETDWVSSLEGGKVYHTDSWGTKDTWTGDFYGGKPYNTIDFEGQNPRHPSLETMTEIDSFELYQKYIVGN